MFLEFVVKLIGGHGPRFFGEFFDERVVFDLGGSDGFDETEFTLVVKVESAGVEMKDNAGLFVGESGGEIIAGVASGVTATLVQGASGLDLI